jgi:xylono-1,5-lactonase
VLGKVRWMEWELIASGFGLVEGPVVDVDGTLVFSDVLDGGVYRLLADGSVTTLVPKRRGVGGIVRHAHGGFVIGGRDLQHVGPDEPRPVLAIEGVLGFNDLCADSDGRVYVGSVRYRSLDRDAIPVPGELWRLDLDGTATVLYDGVQQCNGVAISADGTTIYHADTQAGCLIVHDLSPDGSQANNRRDWSLGPRSHPDGIALDETGAIWVADHGAGRVVRVTPDGEVDSTIAVPAKYLTSLCFDDSDLIVVTANNDHDRARRGSIFRATVGVRGAAVDAANV